MLNIVGLIFILCFTTAVYADASMNSLNMSPRVLNGVQFDRSEELKFRGQEAELFPLKNVLKAFFGDSSIFIESLEFSAISLILQDKFWYSNGEDQKITLLRKSFCQNNYDDHTSKYCKLLENTYISDNQTLKDAVKYIIDAKGILNQEEANLETKKIIDRQFSYESSNSILSRLINYQSGRYQDYPVDVIFSTIYPQNAAIYGDTIISFKDNRSVDISYYNGVRNNAWGIRGDAGEIITPAYVKGSEVQAVYLRKRGEYPDKLRQRVTIDIYNQQKNAPIEYALVKRIIRGKVYVFVYDGDLKGQKSSCLRLNRAGDLMHCQWTTPEHMHNDRYVLIGHQATGSNSRYIANLIGAITLDDGKALERDELFSKVKYFSNKKLNLNLKNSNGVGQESIASTLQSLKIQNDDKSYKLKFIKGIVK